MVSMVLMRLKNELMAKLDKRIQTEEHLKIYIYDLLAYLDEEELHHAIMALEKT